MQTIVTNCETNLKKYVTKSPRTIRSLNASLLFSDATYNVYNQLKLIQTPQFNFYETQRKCTPFPCNLQLLIICNVFHNTPHTHSRVPAVLAAQ